MSLTTNVHLTTLSMMDAEWEYNNSFSYNATSFPYEDISSHKTPDYKSEENLFFNLETFIIMSILVICILGAVGNGIVIWLLGFCIKRNPFITYILNLAIADFGLLVSLIIIVVVNESFGQSYLSNIIFALFFFLFLLMSSAGQFLLTAISIDRCVAVFFPLWYRCRRQPHLSTVVCVLIWVLSTLLSFITIIIQIINFHGNIIVKYYQLIVNAVLCLPFMTSAAVALFIKACCKSQHQRGKLLTVILLTLLFFLFLAFPFNVLAILSFYNYIHLYFEVCALALSCLNSSANPLIYFLVGRERKAGHRESLKLILQRVFKEEEGCAEELQPPAETQL
ncbi:mas-related G-protein coupled receptor member H-like [Eublepharis macularius]|uniref:Mas-related G-protein coupled receptor member H-like n=1 Tax=Eublepharis macularius TaxID=481883 RepID=A0AA97L4S4_EUBMA|nr:mas-related G-protein coupled receptor member H-like [Eublepharis macularius]